MKNWKKAAFVGLLLVAASTAFGALGTNVVLKMVLGGLATNPVSIQSEWSTARDAGGVDAADASPLIDATGSITASTAKILELGKVGGTGLIFRFAYQGSVSTSPIIRVFGRTNPSEQWMVLPNKSGDDTIELTVDTTNDGSDGAGTPTRYTTVVLDEHYVDAMGCKYILVGVQTAQSGGTAAVSFIQAKGF